MVACMLHIMAVVHQDDGFTIGRVATSTIEKPCIILPAAAVGHGKSQASRVHQGCGAQGTQQRSRYCCCLNNGMQSRHCRASVHSQVEHQQLAPCIWCCAAKVEHGCTSRSQGLWQSHAPSHLLHLLLLWIISRRGEGVHARTQGPGQPQVQ